MDDSLLGHFTKLVCRTVRIGSYKVVPKEKVLLSSEGVQIHVPTLADENEVATLTIKFSELIKVLIHFSSGMPVLFLYTTLASGIRIRSLLKMLSKDGPYYDPCSADETQKRITLLPVDIQEDTKMILKKIFASPETLLVEINNNEANEILVRTSPMIGTAFLMKRDCPTSDDKEEDKIEAGATPAKRCRGRPKGPKKGKVKILQH